MPLLPTLAGARVAADEGRVFLTSTFKPPALALPVHLLKDGRRWGALYERLGVREVDGPKYLWKVLLPALAQLDPDQRHAAAEWLRDHLQGLLAQLGDHAPAARKQLREIPLVWGPEGRLWPASALHDPESKILQEVLGESAVYPDRARYRAKHEQWFAFFRTIGLISELSAENLVTHLEGLLVGGPASVKALKRVFDYLDEHWKDLSKAKLRLGGLELTLAQALSARAWMPAKLSSKRPGFQVPAARLYLPSELAQDDALVGSQLPVSEWSVPATMAGELGMIRQPPAAAVLGHLQHLIGLWTSEAPSPEQAKNFGANFLEIYRHLDRYCDPRPAPGSPSFSHTEQQLMASLRERECIWDTRTARLWRPAHTFACPVPFFEPLRVAVAPGLGDRFLDRLGRRSEPELEDFVDFLGALHHVSGDAQLSVEQRKQAIYVLSQIASDPPDEPLPLVLRDGRLQLSEDVYWDDAPWLSDRLGTLAVAASDVPVPVLVALGVRRVSQHVQERLVQVTRTPVERAAEGVCATLAQRVHTTEFARGLLRLLRHDHEAPELEVDLSAVRHLNICPASLIVVETILNEDHSLGRSESKHYYDERRHLLYLVGSAESRLAKWIVQVIVRILGEHAPKTLGALEHILQCDPSDVEEVLHEDKITAVQVEASQADWGAESSYTELDGDQPWAVEAAPEEDPELGAVEPDGGEDGAPPQAEPVTHQREPPRMSRTGTPPSIPLPRAPGSGPQRPGLSPRLAPHLGDEPPVADALSLLPSDQLWGDTDEDRPPTPSTTGRPRVRRDGVGGEVLRLEADTGPPEEVSREVEERALAEAMSFELSQGRGPLIMPDNNPGFDIQSTDDAGKVRLIEVKGLARDWRSHPVMLTQTQLMYAIQHRGDYWVYVVERTSGTPRLHPIRDPAAHVTRFALSASWARYAETAPPLDTPREGLILLEDGRPVGQILRLQSAGPLHHVWVAGTGGVERRVVFQPGQHTLMEPGDGESTS